MGLPQQHETDMSNPEERFLWALRGISYNGMPFMAPEQVFREWSKHLSQTGFVHVDQIADLLRGAGVAQSVIDLLPRQEIHYQPPVRGQDHPLNASGQWQSVDQPIQQPVVPATALMTPQEKAKMIAELREAGDID